LAESRITSRNIYKIKTHFIQNLAMLQGEQKSLNLRWLDIMGRRLLEWIFSAEQAPKVAEAKRATK